MSTSGGNALPTANHGGGNKAQQPAWATTAAELSAAVDTFGADSFRFITVDSLAMKGWSNKMGWQSSDPGKPNYAPPVVVYTDKEGVITCSGTNKSTHKCGGGIHTQVLAAKELLPCADLEDMGTVPRSAVVPFPNAPIMGAPQHQQGEPAGGTSRGWRRM